MSDQAKKKNKTSRLYEAKEKKILKPWPIIYVLTAREGTELLEQKNLEKKCSTSQRRKRQEEQATPIGRLSDLIALRPVLIDEPGANGEKSPRESWRVTMRVRMTIMNRTTTTQRLQALNINKTKTTLKTLKRTHIHYFATDNEIFFDTFLKDPQYAATSTKDPACFSIDVLAAATRQQVYHLLHRYGKKRTAGAPGPE